MIENQQLAQEEIPNPEPNSEIQLTKIELKEKIDYYWKAIDSSNNYTEYKEAFDQLNYYRDLKQSLYK